MQSSCTGLQSVLPTVKTRTPKYCTDGLIKLDEGIKLPSQVTDVRDSV